jgi:periplasmic divalent cation tolerance protein
MYIIWTTVEKSADAERIAAELIARQLAVCVQVDGPIVSHYRWENKPQRSEEYRLWIKCLPGSRAALERHVFSVHPYDTPQWIVVVAEQVGEKYLSWAKANSSTPPL